MNKCEVDTCADESYRILEDGTCEKCDEFKRPMGDNKELCGSDTCSEIQILQSDGTCKDCPLYNRSLDGRNCG